MYNANGRMLAGDYFTMVIADDGKVRVYRPSLDYPVLTAITPRAAFGAMRMVFGAQNFIRVKTKVSVFRQHIIFRPIRHGNVYEVS